MEDLTGYPIQKFLPENLPSTRERVPDLMGILANGRPVHLELMGYNDPRIDTRMYDVRGSSGMPTQVSDRCCRSFFMWAASLSTCRITFARKGYFFNTL
jgi:hypothetical protein